MELLFVHQFQRKCKEAGWEGSAHDSRILNDALNRPRGLQIPEGRYYLGDAGYGVRKGVISPYRSVRYHLNEFSDNPPRNGKELFNLRHSSLRTTIERCFGILKKRFRVLDAEPFWSFPTQVDVVLACCIIHNHIIGVDPLDSIVNDVALDTQFENGTMGVKKDTQKEKDVKNFRWSTPMENLLLEILADEALQGNKPSNIFKPSSYRKVVEAINEKFGVDCSQKHVENRFRTLKGNWNTITELRQKSGFGWDDDLKMITCDRNVYDEAVAARPSHEKFLNKKIEMYDELALVVGKDMATGSFSKGVTDIDRKGVNDVDMSASNTIDLDNDLEEVSLKKQADSSTQTRSHRKRSHASMLDDTIFKDLSSQMGKIASAIQEASLHRTNFFSNLYEEVMKIEGFEESMLASAFDHLNENEVLARSFMLKSDKLRKQWLDNFFYRNG
uniref:Myb/SANT-like domain-containing protein n=1 Tax=Fagus sylvatica TaxID=28930 RepID=A0A2N9I3Z0_FAGSY